MDAKTIALFLEPVGIHDGDEFDLIHFSAVTSTSFSYARAYGRWDVIARVLVSLAETVLAECRDDRASHTAFASFAAQVFEAYPFVRPTIADVLAVHPDRKALSVLVSQPVS